MRNKLWSATFKRVSSPKTKSTQTFMNVEIWQKFLSILHAFLSTWAFFLNINDFYFDLWGHTLHSCYFLKFILGAQKNRRVGELLTIYPKFAFYLWGQDSNTLHSCSFLKFILGTKKRTGGRAWATILHTIQHYFLWLKKKIVYEVSTT